jgi:hypothetical protein
LKKQPRKAIIMARIYKLLEPCFYEPETDINGIRSLNCS